MGATLPNPTVPTNGQPLDATPILQNELALLQAIQQFDASQIVNGSLSASAFNASINPNTLLKENTFDHVASGCVWSGDSYAGTLNGSMTSGVVYINGIRVTVNTIAAHAFTASKDTYVDVDVNGNITYSEVTNNAASPSLAANSIRLAIIISGAGSIAAATSVNQGQETMILPIASSIAYSVTDSLGNLICSRDPNRKILGYKQIITNFTGPGSSTPTQITGLSCPIIVPTGRKVKITLKTPAIQNSTSPFDMNIAIWDGVVNSGTQLSLEASTVPSNNYLTSLISQIIITPTATSKIYNGDFHNNSGTGTVIAGATKPAFILVELE